MQKYTKYKTNKMPRLKKRFGQHFLTDIEVLHNINSYIKQEINVKQQVLEIGIGDGALTNNLKNHFEKYKAIEIDEGWHEKAEDKWNGEDIILGDCLKMDWGAFFMENNYNLIGNFPYNISSQILFKVLDNKDRVDNLVGMFQWEVGRRVCSKMKKKDYGILSVLVQAFYNTKEVMDVDKNSFTPPPQVKSIVIHLSKKKEQPKVDYLLFKKLVKECFGKRRKILKNNLNLFTFENNIEKYYSKRAEELEVEDFIYLANSIAK